jgi:hypothetical protein
MGILIDSSGFLRNHSNIGAKIDQKYFGSSTFRPGGRRADRKSQFDEQLGMVGEIPTDTMATMSDDEKKLRGMSMDIIGSAFGDNTDFMDNAFGRLLSAQSMEGTDAGIRDFMARTGSSGSAAAAATASSLRAGGAASMHQAALAARSKERSEAGGFLSFMAQSIGQQNQRGQEAAMFNAQLRASIVQGIVSREHDMQKLDKSIALSRWQVAKNMEQQFYNAINKQALQTQQQLDHAVNTPFKNSDA